MEPETAHSFESRAVPFASAGHRVFIPRLVRTNTKSYYVSEELYSEGTYGLTYLTNENRLIKFVPAIDDCQPKTEIVEMQIHKQIEEITQTHKLPQIVPRLYDTFITTTLSGAKPTIGFVMEHLHGPNLTNFLSTRLMKLAPHAETYVYESIIKANDTLILTVLAQIASILLPLQKTIEFNHRDLHGQNIIMCQSNVSQTITIGDKTTTLGTIGGYWPYLIDFGFARTRDHTTLSIFNEDPWKSSFVAGRDICHLVYFILVYLIGIDENKGPIGSVRRVPISIGLRRWLMSLVTIKARQCKGGPYVKTCLIWPGIVWDDWSGKTIRFNSMHNSRELSWTNIYLALNCRDVIIDTNPEEILRYYASTTENLNTPKPRSSSE